MTDSHANPGARKEADTADDLDLLINSAHGHAIYMLDPDGRVKIWNKGAEYLTGWTEAEAVGQHVVMFYPPEAVAEGKPDADLARAATEGRYELEDWRQRKDGSRFLANITVTALYDDAGQLRGFAKILSDITQRRTAEEALRASARHLRSILSTVPNAMIVIDENASILSFSTAATKLFGYEQEEILGHNISQLMPSPDRERHDDYIRRYLEDGKSRIIGRGRDVMARKKDGTIFPVELSVGEAMGDHGRLFTGFMRDLSERQRTDEKIAALQAELIHVSRVSAMGAMASTLAHELNQPITAVVNYVEAVRDLLTEPDPEQLPMIREALDDAAKEALRAGDIVRHLRDFVARREIEKTVEHLPALIHEAAAFALMDAHERAVDTTFDLDPQASPVLVDKVQVQQVLINLLRNAIDAVSDGPERRLIVTSQPGQPGFVQVTIADSGVGISPDVARRLFNAFFSTKSKGMGLGLSICRTIIEANGGRIWMEPRAKGGTSFHFTLVHAQTEQSDDG